MGALIINRDMYIKFPFLTEVKLSRFPRLDHNVKYKFTIDLCENIINQSLMSRRKSENTHGRIKLIYITRKR